MQHPYTGATLLPLCHTLMRSMLSTFLAILLAAAQVVTTTAQAQSALPDAEPPVIEVEEVPTSASAGDQVFLAQVVDDRELQEVLLYHRREGQQAFVKIPMQVIGESSFYRAIVPSDAEDLRAIEYYVQARDRGGNRTVFGFAFDPLVRTFDPALALANEPGAAAEPGNATSQTAAGSLETRSPIKWWHVALGVLAVGAVAAAAGGSDGGGNASGTVPLTINLGEPQ